MNLFRNFSIKLFSLFFLGAFLLVAFPFNSAKAIFIPNINCGINGTSVISKCDMSATLNKSSYAPGEHIDGQLWVNQSGNPYTVVGPNDVSIDNKAPTRYATSGSTPYKTADTAVGSFNAPSAGCYNMHFSFQWHEYGDFSGSIDVPYAVAPSTCGGSGGGGTGGNGSVPTPVVSFSAVSPVYLGSPTTLTWSATHAKNCSIVRYGPGATETIVLNGAISGNMSYTPTSLGINNFQITCENNDDPNSPTVGFLQENNKYLAGINIYNSFRKIVSTLTPKVFASSVNPGGYNYAWGTAFADVNVLPPAPPKTVAMLFSNNSSHSLTISSPSSVNLFWQTSGFSNITCTLYDNGKSITTTNLSTGNFPTEIKSASTDFTIQCHESGGTNIPDPEGPDHLIVTGPSFYIDLTAGGVTPATAIPGTTVSFTTTITNNGTGSTVDSFSNIFETATGFDDAFSPLGVKSYSSVMTPLAAGGSNTFSKSIQLATTDVFIRACADKSSAANTGSIIESNEENNCSGWMQLTPLPDLIALLPTTNPTTGIKATVPFTISSVIKNQGNASTGAAFMNFFQISTIDPNGGQTASAHKNNFLSSILPRRVEAAGVGGGAGQSIINLPATAMSTLAANSINVATTSYHLDNDGLYWVRACADKSNPGSAGNITELNESNNCSGWAQIVVGDAPINGVCGATHYNCTQGTSSNHTSGMGNYSWDCLGTNGGNNAIGCTEAMPPTMSGTLTPESTSCLISKGDSTCSINFSWTTNNPQGTSAVVKPPYPGTVVGTGNNRNNFPLTVKYNGETFYLYNNQQILDQKTVTSSCEPGSFWKGGICNVVTTSPDLTAGRISPVLVPIKDVTNFVVEIINQGDASTVKKFSNLFQLADDIDQNNNGINVIDLNSGAAILAGPLAANSNQTIKFPYSFFETGTKYMRACADKDSAGDVGTITESDEDNNCGPWTMITIVDRSVDGECADVVFGCNFGNSINNVPGDPKTPSTWDCEGILGGQTASCSKDYGTCSPGLTNPPLCDVCENGANNPPTCTNECQNGAVDFPDCKTCKNGATNPPICTSECDNGAVNYPTCNLCDNGAKNPPICNEDRCLNGALNYPDCNLCQNGATNPPLCNDESHHCDNGAFNYSDCTICANGATNPPECTGGCENGAYNYPFCTTCANGAVNPSRCTVNKSGKCLNGKTNPPVCAKKSPIYIER